MSLLLAHPTLGVQPSWGEGWAVSTEDALDVPSHSHQPGPVGLDVTVVRGSSSTPFISCLRGWPTLGELAGRHTWVQHGLAARLSSH